MQKGILLGLAVIVASGIAGWSSGQSAALQPAPVSRSAVGAADGLITHHVPGGATGEHLVVIDAQTRVMAVYRVSREGGEIALASVRRIDSDLKLLSYNTERPLPEEIEAGLKRQEY